MRRYQVLAASILIQLCLGGIYAWSTFVPALGDSYGLTKAQAGMVFGVTIAAFTLAMLYAGRLQDRRGPRLVAGIGAVLFGSGYFLASFSGGAYSLLLLALGLISGAGIGFGYVCPLATCIKWFPKQKGLITGLAVAGFGGGAVLLSGMAEALLVRGMDVLMVFRWIGMVYGGVVLLAAFGLSTPEPPVAAAAKAKEGSVSVLAQKRFWLLVLGMFAGTFGGLLVIGNLKPIALWAGLASAQAVLSVTLFAVGNAVGRIVWGWLHDRLGWATIPLSLSVLAAGILCLGVAESPAVFLASAGLIGFSFGACFILYAAEVASEYGAQHLGSIYPMVFLAYGVSGIIGPSVGGGVYDFRLSYLPAILLATGMVGSVALYTGFLVCRSGSLLQKDGGE